MPRQDPLTNFRFRLEIDGVTAAGFCEVSLGECSTDVIEYREGTDTSIRKLPGLTRYSNVVLKRGITQSMELYQWYNQVVTGQIANARRAVAVVLTDEAFNDVARFVIRNAWPAKYEASSLHAEGNCVAIETLELTHEGLERVQ